MSKKQKIKWTEKVQAIASIVAIIAAIVTFSTLFIKDKDLQTQIENLSTIANQSVEQTNLLRQELTVLSERNRILIDQLEIDKDKWNKQIRPNFAMNFSEYEDWIFETKKEIVKGFDLVNTGSSANIIKIVYNKNNNCKIDIPFAFVPKNGTIDFSLSYNKKDSVVIDLYLIYSDIEHNVYRQRFKSDKVYSEIFHSTDGSDIFKSLNVVAENPELLKK